MQFRNVKITICVQVLKCSPHSIFFNTNFSDDQFWTLLNTLQNIPYYKTKTFFGLDSTTVNLILLTKDCPSPQKRIRKNHPAKPNNAIEIVPKRFWSTFWMYHFGSNSRFGIEKWRGQFFLLGRLIQRKKDLKSVFLRPFPMDVVSDKRLSKYIDRV